MSAPADTGTTTPARLRTLLDQAAELARLLLKSSQPPRELVSRTLHGRKRLTADERQFISSAAHHALRCWRFSRHCALDLDGDVDLRPTETECRTVTAAAVLLADAELLPDPTLTDIRGIAAPTLTEAASLLLRDSAAIDPELLRTRALDLARRAELLRANPPSDGDEESARQTAALRASLPGWIVRSWRDQPDPLSFAAILDIGMALCAPPPLTVRVNRLRSDPAGLMAAFAGAGIDARRHTLLGDALVLTERIQLIDTPWYHDGLFEVQDAGSQLIALACRAVEGTSVLDACAGGGGKTMQLADLLRDRASITACDIERPKLRGLEQRAARLGLQGVRTQHVPATGENLPGIDAQAYDTVLVDAPCSGFGTVRRNPAHKWRLAERTVTRLAERQEAILTRYAQAVRPGGTLVYATCSLLPQENANVVSRFLEKNPSFHPDPLPIAEGDQHMLLIRPDQYDSDGFFVARMMADDK